MDGDHVFLSAITLAELRDGIDRMPVGARRRQLDLWLRAVLSPRFESRILPVDAAMAGVCGGVLARRQAAGKPIEAMDAVIAATAEAHDRMLVTHNVFDFKTSLKIVLDPWT
jgi:predicted nucleic acid-binding protein